MGSKKATGEGGGTGGIIQLSALLLLVLVLLLLLLLLVLVLVLLLSRCDRIDETATDDRDIALGVGDDSSL